MMTILEKIKNRLENGLKVDLLEIHDESEQHKNHHNHSGGAHLQMLIVSSGFEQKSLLDRHKMVYLALADMIKKDIHALSLKTYTLNEWNQLKKG